MIVALVARLGNAALAQVRFEQAERLVPCESEILAEAAQGQDVPSGRRADWQVDLWKLPTGERDANSDAVQTVCVKTSS